MENGLIRKQEKWIVLSYKLTLYQKSYNFFKNPVKSNKVAFPSLTQPGNHGAPCQRSQRIPREGERESENILDQVLADQVKLSTSFNVKQLGQNMKGINTVCACKQSWCQALTLTVQRLFYFLHNWKMYLLPVDKQLSVSWSHEETSPCTHWKQLGSKRGCQSFLSVLQNPYVIFPVGSFNHEDMCLKCWHTARYLILDQETAIYLLQMEFVFRTD